MNNHPLSRMLPYATGTLSGRVAALKAQLVVANDGSETATCLQAVNAILEAAVSAERTILNQRELISELQVSVSRAPQRLRRTV